MARPGPLPDSSDGERPPQGEALATWALWIAMAAIVVATYSRVAPEETYHVSRDGLAGGLSRALTLANFPIALVAIGLMLVALPCLPRVAWWVAGPAIAACASIPWVVDQANLDARPGNAIPALGVAVAGVLTIAATRRSGAAFAPPRRWDPARVVVAVVVLLVSLPWAAAEVGFHFPGDVFMGEEPGREADGSTIAAVHLGHHHGTDGALLVLSALLLSRMRVAARGLRLVVPAYLGAMLAYGGVNFVQDAWNEQLVKRGTVDSGIPSALLPGLRPIWLVVVVLAFLAAWALLREREGTSYSAA